MLQSKVFLDLPSEEVLRDKTVGEWFLSLFGATPDLRDGTSVLSISGVAILDGVIEGFRAAGMENAIALVVDGRAIFTDPNDEPDDMEAMYQVAVASGALRRHFQELQLAITHSEDGLRLIAEVDLRNRVLLGHEELTITLSARLEELQVQEAESASKYRSRVHHFAEQEGAFAEHVETLGRITQRLVRGLRAAFPGAEVRSQSPRIRLIRLRAGQIQRLRSLRFGRRGMAPRFRNAPARRRRRSQPMIDPFYRYYFDPYYDFALWTFFDALLHTDLWHREELYFHEPDGTLIGRGDIIDADTLGGQWERYAAIDDDMDLDPSDDLDDALHADAGGHEPDSFGDVHADDVDGPDDIGALDDPMWEEPASYDEEWGIEPAPVFDRGRRSFVSVDEFSPFDDSPDDASVDTSPFFDEPDRGTSFGDPEWQESFFGQSFGEIGQALHQSSQSSGGSSFGDSSFGSSSDSDFGGGSFDDGFGSGFGDSDSNDGFGSDSFGDMGSDFSSSSDDSFGSFSDTSSGVGSDSWDDSDW